ncbi:MAG: tyrosine-type recombinase/integrase, partial [Velocimicrobium sp.]
MKINTKECALNYLLHSLPYDGKISLSDIAELQKFMTKENKLKEVCDLTRIKQRTDDGRCYIYINRKQFIGSDYADLINRLYQHFYGILSYTLTDLFPKWLLWRRDNTKVSNKTLKEYMFLWNALYKDTAIVTIPITKLNTKSFIQFFRTITKEGSLSRKRFNDGKSILNGIYYYSIEQGIVESNPLNNINYRIFNYKPINDVKNIYSLEEREKLLKHLSDNNDIYSLAIQFDFHIIARIGELKSLKWSDISNNIIRIQTQLLEDQTMNDDLSFNARTHQNVEHIKGNTSHGFRNIPLTPSAIAILNRIREVNPDGQYILMHDGKQLTTVTFNRHLKKFCNEAGIPYRSSHKIRFTVASVLHKNGVPDTILQEWLGHTQLSMTLHYYGKQVLMKSNKLVSLQI